MSEPMRFAQRSAVVGATKSLKFAIAPTVKH